MISACSGPSGSPVGRRNARDQGLEQLLNALAGLGAHPQRIPRLETDDLLDLHDDPLRLGRGQVDLVQHREHLQPLLDRGVAVGHALGLDPLRGIHHQQRALAGGQRARDLVGEIHVPGRVDEIELVDLAVRRLVIQRHALGLDGDAALTLQIHGVEHLLRHLALAQARRSAE